MLSTHTARKSHRCAAGSTCALYLPVIAAGDLYAVEKYPPWTLTQEDPDSPLTKLGEWVTHRYHLGCGPWA